LGVGVAGICAALLRIARYDSTVFQEKSVRPILAALALVVIALPAQAQRRERYKIATEELATFTDQSMADVIARARPQFLQIGDSHGSTQTEAEGGDSQGRCASFGCQANELVVYVGGQAQGDSTQLRYYKADQVKEVRFYKPNEAMARLGANGHAYVIQLILKDAVAP
jgi:hypothetical protein